MLKIAVDAPARVFFLLIDIDSRFYPHTAGAYLLIVVSGTVVSGQNLFNLITDYCPADYYHKQGKAQRPE